MHKQKLEMEENATLTGQSQSWNYPEIFLTKKKSNVQARSLSHILRRHTFERIYESWNRGKTKTNEQLPHLKKIPMSTFFLSYNLHQSSSHWLSTSLTGGVSNSKQHFSFMSKSCSVSTIERKSWFSEVAAGVIDRDSEKVTPRGNAGSWIPTLPGGTWTIYRAFFFF